MTTIVAADGSPSGIGIILLLTLAVAVVWVVRVLRYPEVRCWRCNGAGRLIYLGRFGRECPWCHGAKWYTRMGRRFLAATFSGRKR